MHWLVGVERVWSTILIDVQCSVEYATIQETPLGPQNWSLEELELSTIALYTPKTIQHL